jgi:hypothetical protein
MPRSTGFALKTERLGPLPLINHLIERIGLEALLEQHVPTADRRCTVTVMPRSRQEDGHFRKWVQTQTPEWELVCDRPHPRYHDGPCDRWSVYRDPLGSREGWSRVWVWSTLLTLHQQSRRHRNLAAATEALTALRQRV